MEFQNCQVSEILILLSYLLKFTDCFIFQHENYSKRKHVKADKQLNVVHQLIFIFIHLQSDLLDPVFLDPLMLVKHVYF